jgi:hypothetical protein
MIVTCTLLVLDSEHRPRSCRSPAGCRRDKPWLFQSRLTPPAENRANPAFFLSEAANQSHLVAEMALPRWSIWLQPE